MSKINQYRPLLVLLGAVFFASCGVESTDIDPEGLAGKSELLNGCPDDYDCPLYNSRVIVEDEEKSQGDQTSLSLHYNNDGEMGEFIGDFQKNDLYFETNVWLASPKVVFTYSRNKITTEPFESYLSQVGAGGRILTLKVVYDGVDIRLEDTYQ